MKNNLSSFFLKKWLLKYLKLGKLAHIIFPLSSAGLGDWFQSLNIKLWWRLPSKVSFISKQAVKQRYLSNPPPAASPAQRLSLIISCKGDSSSENSLSPALSTSDTRDVSGTSLWSRHFLVSLLESYLIALPKLTPSSAASMPWPVQVSVFISPDSPQRFQSSFLSPCFLALNFFLFLST